MGDKWELIGKLKSSEWRLRVLKILEKEMKQPSELSKEANISSSHISEVIRNLEELKLIECKNPNLRKGKIYSITNLGKEILKEIK
jgi:ArsR family transcriptional regulator, cadmium/lead-responsive transcriptional repressor